MDSGVILVIPARYESARFPGKPLAAIPGADGNTKTLVQWTWEAAARVRGVDQILIATDDDRIAETVSRFGGHALLTSRRCRNGTERCAEAARLLGMNDGIVVNFQGDAPLTPPGAVEALIEHLRDEPGTAIVTPRVRCTPEMIERLAACDRAGIAGGTTVVIDEEQDALYFSKRLLPFLPAASPAPVFLHIGAYAYRAATLARYAEAAPTILEEVEGLEQLRFLHHRIRVRTLEIPLPRAGLWEINHPSDITLVERGLGLGIPA